MERRDNHPVTKDANGDVEGVVFEAESNDALDDINPVGASKN